MIAVVVAAFCVGWLLSFVRRLPDAFLARCEQYVIVVALPSLIIAKMSQVSIERALFIPIGAAWTVMTLCVVAVLGLSRVYSWGPTVVGGLLCVAVLGNTSFMGLGMVEGLLGRDHLVAAIAYDQLGTFLALALWSAFVVARFGKDTLSSRDILRRIFRFAPFIALLMSAVVRVTSLPQWTFDVLEFVGRTVTPVAMLTVGLRFSLSLPRRVLAPALWALAIKMFIIPALVCLCVVVTQSQGDIMWSTVLVQSAAPPMVTAGVVAIRGGLDEEVVSFVVGAGTLVGFVSVPLWSLVV